MFFAEKICNFFQAHAQNKAKKVSQSTENAGWGGGFCVFVKFFEFLKNLVILSLSLESENPKILVILSVAKNPHFNFVDTSLTLSMTRGNNSA